MHAESATSKNHRNIIRDKNHLYRVVRHQIQRYKQENTDNLIRVFKKIIKSCNLPRYLPDLEAKQSSARAPFYATTTNPLVGCAFCGSDKCLPSALCHSFYLQLNGCLLFLPGKHIKELLFCVNTFLKGTYLKF